MKTNFDSVYTCCSSSVLERIQTAQNEGSVILVCQLQIGVIFIAAIHDLFTFFVILLIDYMG